MIEQNSKFREPMQADIAPAFQTATTNPFSSEELGKDNGDRELDDYKWG